MCSTKGLLAQLLVLPKRCLCFTLLGVESSATRSPDETHQISRIFKGFIPGSMVVWEYKRWSDRDLDPGDVADANPEVFSSSGQLCLCNNI